MEFDWDPAKAEGNFRDHLFSIEEAKTVIEDGFNVEFYDQDHSDDEHRFIMIGHSSSGSFCSFHLPNAEK